MHPKPLTSRDLSKPVQTTKVDRNMPSYEIFLVFAPRTTRPNLLKTLRKVGAEVVKTGGVIRDFEHWGIRHTADTMIRHGNHCTEAR